MPFKSGIAEAQIYRSATNKQDQLRVRWYQMSNTFLQHQVQQVHVYVHVYRNDPKFSARYAWANSADPDQTASRVNTVVQTQIRLLLRISCIFCFSFSLYSLSASNTFVGSFKKGNKQTCHDSWQNIFMTCENDKRTDQPALKCTLMFLSFYGQMTEQTLQTQNRLLLRVYTVCHSVCIFRSYYSLVRPPSQLFYSIHVQWNR